MNDRITSPLSQKYNEIIEKIKAFTFTSPSNSGIYDPDYKVYLAKCCTLLNLDVQLNSLCYTYEFEDPDQYKEIEEELLDIEQEVDKLVKL